MSSADTTLPMDWLPLREAAEAEARAFIGMMDAIWHGVATSTAPERGRIYDTHAALLADLTRSTTRDHWARKLAEWVGLDVGATAPTWVRRGGAHPDWGLWTWSLEYDDAHVWFSSAAPTGMRGWREIHGISAITDPAAALRLALLAVRPFPLPPELPDV